MKLFNKHVATNTPVCINKADEYKKKTIKCVYYKLGK